MEEVKELTTAEAHFLIENYDSYPTLLLGKYYHKTEDGIFVGIDNQHGCCYVEEFDDFRSCYAWLRD